MKNTTLSRKPTNDMKKNSGFQPDSRRNDQSGDGEDFAFNGQMGNGVNRDNSRDSICVNPYNSLVKNPDQINKGMGPRTGNASDSHSARMTEIGPSVTRDPNSLTIATANEGHNVGQATEMKRFPNPDSIYMSRGKK